MTESSIDSDNPQGKPALDRRHRDGAGKSDSSFKKHELVEHLAAAQCAVLSRLPGRGLIVDMHAGDGEGVSPTQLSLFGDSSSRATARTAGLLAMRHEALCILCESDKKKREALQLLASQIPECLLIDDNLRLMEIISRGQFGWALILNDPCGHSGHATEVMWHLSRCVPKADFLVVINEGSLKRHLALKEDDGQDSGRNAALVRGARASAERYRWMLDHGQWCFMLGKRYAVTARELSGRKGFKGRVCLFTGFTARFDRKIFECKDYREEKQCA